MAPPSALLMPRQMAASSDVIEQDRLQTKKQRVRIEGYALVCSDPLEVDVIDPAVNLKSVTFRQLLEQIVALTPAPAGFDPHGQKSYRGIPTVDFLREALHLTGEMHGYCGYGLRILLGGTKPVWPHEIVRDYITEGPLDLTVDCRYN